MASLDEILAGLQETNTAVEAIDKKLDEIKAFIVSIKAGGSITQAQLDQVAALVSSAKSTAAKVLTEADALDE